MSKGRQTLDMMVTAAVGALLVGRDEIDLAQAERELPDHIRSAGPSHKAIAKAIQAAGWVARRHAGGHVVYVRDVPPAADGEGEGDERGLGDNISAEALRLYMERLDTLEDERRGIGEDIKDVYAEAKSTGFDVATMRTVRKIRGKEKHQRDEGDALVDMYRKALRV